MPLPGQSGNVVLDNLADRDREALAPHLTEMEVAKGAVLIRQGEKVRVLHFPVTADLSNSLIFADGRAIEATSVGRDGVSGLAACLADAPIAWEVICQVPGKVIAVDADLLRARLRTSPDLMDLMLRITHENQSQAAQTAACNALHDATQRFARWLLMAADRTGRTRMEVTQDGVAAQLGAQRTTINTAAQTLRRRKAIAFSRGRLRIESRAALEAAACECYRTHIERRRALGLPLSHPLRPDAVT